MSGDLDSILSGETPAPEAVEAPTPETQPEAVAPAPEPDIAEPPSGQPRDEKGRFAPKSEAETPSENPEPEFDHKAVLGERRRRQEAEARAMQLEQRLAALEQQLRPQPEPINDDLMFTDPAKYREAVAAQIRRDLQQEAQNWTQQSAISVRMDVSEMLAKKNHPDYDDKFLTFRDMVVENPGLATELARQQDPAEWAYQKAASWSAIQEVGSIDALREKIRAEVLAEVQQPAPTPAPVIPTSLADAPASGPVGEAPVRPMSLDEIIKRR